MVKSTIAVLSVSLVILFMASGMATANLFSDRGLYPAACIITDPSATTLNDVARALEKNGVHGLQMFPPDVIFGHFPAHVNASILEGMRAELVTSPEDIRLKSLSPLVRGAVRALMREEEIFRAAIADDVTIEPFRDLVLEVPDEIKRQWKYEGPRKGSPGEIMQRGLNQNSEFLIGTILVNVVFPESNGGSENWTDEELANAAGGISLGHSQYQQHTLWLDPLRLSFIYNYHERIPVSIEPIEGGMGTDPIWMEDALDHLGYYPSHMWGAHELNNATREAYEGDHGVTIDWVFTLYVADASENGCWLQGNYVAYAYLGGPYMLVPYPACRFDTQIGFAHIVIHEMSHVFWALDEYVSAETPCSATSGYMNVENRNTYYNPCQPLMDCIMNNAALESPLPICDYTLGQVGLWDEDPRNSIVDIFEVPPTVKIEIALGFSDTLVGEGEYPVVVEVTNDAKPNRNPGQDPGERIDYAPWIRSATYSLNNAPDRVFYPNDTKWDESHELAAFWMSGFMPGKNVLRVTVENCVRAKGQAEREYYYVGIKYYQTSGQANLDCIDLTWVTTGEVFGSVFDIVREDLTVGTGQVVIGMVEEPDETGGNRSYYSFRDEAIMPGHEYIYHVVASFRLGVNGVVSDFEFPSGEIKATAMIPVTGDLLSYIVPNPTQRSTTFTVKVPSSYYDPSGSNQRTSRVTHAQSATYLMEVKTPVDIRVFDVKGRLVKTIYSNEIWGGPKTETWNGTDERGRDVVSGIYFIRVIAGGKQDVRKVVLIR